MDIFGKNAGCLTNIVQSTDSREYVKIKLQPLKKFITLFYGTGIIVCNPQPHCFYHTLVRYTRLNIVIH